MMNKPLPAFNMERTKQEQHQEEALFSLQVRLLQLLDRYIARYTCGDSSSVLQETAQQLLQSLYFTLNIDQNNLAASALTLYNVDLNQRYAVGISTIKHKLQYGKKLWQAACLSAPDIENWSLQDTLQSIGTFWQCYDYHFAAHEIPCDIDYQLCHPVPASLQGVDYINRYLEHLLTEHKFLQHFERDTTKQLLQGYCADYRELLINLYEPVATNSIGLALLHRDIHKLDITPHEQQELLAFFLPLSKTEAIIKLQQAAVAVCQDLQVQQTKIKPYTKQLAVELYPRIEAALLQRDLSGIFLSLE